MRRQEDATYRKLLGMLQLLFELENFDKKLYNKGINKELKKNIGIEIRIINNTVISSSAKYCESRSELLIILL